MSIVVNRITHVYMPDSPFQTTAVDDVSFTINEGEFTALIGHTGCGKSTLVQVICGLLKPTRGGVTIDGIDVYSVPKAQKRAILHQVGLVFQYPEHQLFEETVYRDIAFGPKNMQLSEYEIDARVKSACVTVGLDFDEIRERSPFELSGGQKRRVAIAGVIAMRPSVLIMDEPAAGLDPRGREEILSLMRSLHASGTTIIFVSHSMEDVARIAHRVLVMCESKIVKDGVPGEIFAHEKQLLDWGLDVPESVKFADALRNCGVNVPEGMFRREDIREFLLKRYAGGAEGNA